MAKVPASCGLPAISASMSSAPRAIGVSTPPGWMLLTRIWSGASSWAKALAIPVIPNLLAVYGTMNGCDFKPPDELIRMMEPPPDEATSGAAAITVFHEPVRLMSMVSCHTSGEVSSQALIRPTPALATTMSSRPNSASPASRAALSPSRSRTSPWRATMRRPAPSTRRTVSSRSAGVAPG